MIRKHPKAGSGTITQGLGTLRYQRRELGSGVSKANTRQQRCSLVLAVRFSTTYKNQRLYLLQYTINLSHSSSTGSTSTTTTPPLAILTHVHWLIRYLTAMVASMKCMGLFITQEQMNTDNDNSLNSLLRLVVYEKGDADKDEDVNEYLLALQVKFLDQPVRNNALSMQDNLCMFLYPP